MSETTPGWDAKEISRIASENYGSFSGMFEKHGWPERGSDMMRKVQTRVKEEYGSVAAFVAKHDTGEGHDSAQKHSELNIKRMTS